MEAQTAKEALKIKLFLEWGGVALGFSFGITFCLILALGYCMLIINAQDSMIHNLLLNVQHLPTIPQTRP